MPEAELNAAIGSALTRAGACGVGVVCLRERDAEFVRARSPSVEAVQSFEAFQDASPLQDQAAEAMRIARDYVNVNWWEIASAERSFVDSSFLVGGLGQRIESHAYVERLIIQLVRHLESVFRNRAYTAAVCPVADSLMIHVFYQVARHFGVEIAALSPNAWIREDGRPAFYVARDEFMHNSKMEAIYRATAERGLDAGERERSRRFQETVAGFNIVKVFQSIAKRDYIVSAVSPQFFRLGRYLGENSARRKDVEYYKISLFAKMRANLLRQWRRWRSGHLLGSRSLTIPPRSVFYPMQYQPEQTTLVGGIYYANQCALIENLAKALPLGSHLIVKEHPRGRGSRPAWQYSHLAHFPNVRFCDADSKEIMKNCDAVVTITSTVGLEAMALDRAVVLLGRSYYDFSEAVYRPQSWPEVAATLRRVLVDREYESRVDRHDLIDRFFLAYLAARIPGVLNVGSADAIAQGVLAELSERRSGYASVTAAA